MGCGAAIRFSKRSPKGLGINYCPLWKQFVLHLHLRLWPISESLWLGAVVGRVGWSVGNQVLPLYTKRTSLEGRGCGQWLVVRDKADSDTAGGALEAAQTSVYSWHTTAHKLTWAGSLHGPLLLHHCSPLGWRCLCWKGGENILKENRASSARSPKTSALSIWDVILPSIGQWQPLSRGETLPYIQFQPKTFHLQPYLLQWW